MDICMLNSHVHVLRHIRKESSGGESNERVLHCLAALLCMYRILRAGPAALPALSRATCVGALSPPGVTASSDSKRLHVYTPKSLSLGSESHSEVLDSRHVCCVDPRLLLPADVFRSGHVMLMLAVWPYSTR